MTNVEQEISEMRKEIQAIAVDVAFMKGRMKNGKRRNGVYIGAGGFGVGAAIIEFIQYLKGIGT